MWRLRNRYVFTNEAVDQLYRSGRISPTHRRANTFKINAKDLSNNENSLQNKVMPTTYSFNVGVPKITALDSFLKAKITGTTLNGSKSILNVMFERRQQLDFPVVWLRDNCRCQSCFDKLSRSRTHDQQLFKCDISPREILAEGSSITIIWEDEHVSEYSKEWLCHHSFSEEHQRLRFQNRYPERTAWNAKDFYEGTQVFRRFSVQDVLENDYSLLKWLQQLAKYGISLLTGAVNGSGELEKIAERVAFIRKTHYGERFSVIGSDDANNVAYKKGALQLHTDLPYYSYMPGIIMLHCIRQSAEGGESILSDGLNAASALPKAMFSVLVKTVVDWVDIGSHENRRFHSLNREPVLCLNPYGQLEKINWSQPQRDSIFNAPIKEVIEWYEAAAEFTRLIHDRRNAVKFKCEAGNILTFDNRRILHGRENYSDPTRLLYGAYIDWDEIYCRIRVLQNDLNIGN